MKYFGSLGTFVILSSLLLVSTAWSSEIESKQLVPGQQSGVEAIVTKVEQESLTLKPTNNDSAEISIPHKDDGTLHVGDRVVLNEKNITKVGDGSSDLLPNDEKTSKESESPAKTP